MPNKKIGPVEPVNFRHVGRNYGASAEIATRS